MRENNLMFSGGKKYFFQAGQHHNKKVSSQTFSFVGLTYRMWAPFIFSTASIFESRFVSNGLYVSVFSFSKNTIPIFLTPHLQNLTRHFVFVHNTA